MAKTKLGRDTEADPQQAFVDDPITLEPGSVAMTLTDATSGATGTVEIEVPDADGFSGINITSADGDDVGSEVHVTSATVGGESLVNVKASAADGIATVRLDAQSEGVAVAGFSARNGVGSATVGITATKSGAETSLVIKDGEGLAGAPGQALLAHATFGSLWSDFPDPLTSADTIVIDVASINQVTVAADGSFEVNGSGVVRLLGLPTADPVAAGQLWNDGGTLKVSAG